MKRTPASRPVRSAVCERLSSGSYELHPFGMEVTDYASFEGVTIPSRGRAGWYFGTDRWDEGVFFRYSVDDLGLIA